MKFNLPTRDECKAITEKSDAFYCAERIVEGQNVELYDYRLASITDFVENNAFELRGICFVQADNGTWERNILLNKFFNFEQTEGWLKEDLTDKKIVRVQNKEDGSIISAVKFGGIGGKIRMKSKMSFESDQAKLAQNIYDNDKKLQDFIEICISNDFTPVFELVGPENQIVLSYNDTELILLQVRDKDATYLTENDMSLLTKSTGIKMAENYNLDLLEHVADIYTSDEIVSLVGDRKFQSLDDFINFLYVD